MNEYVTYKGERCEIVEIIGRVARIATAKGVIPVMTSALRLEEKLEAKDDTPDFEAMTKKELAEYGETHGIEIDLRDKKADIIEQLK